MAEHDATPPAEGHGGNKEEKKEGGFLEGIINELGSFARKAFTVGAIAAMPYIFSFWNPAFVLPAQAFTYPVVAGRAAANVMQKKPVLEGTVKEAIGGTAFAPVLGYMYPALQGLEANVTREYGIVAGKSASVGVHALAVTPASTALHTVFNYGIEKDFWNSYKSRLKSVYKYIALPSAINIAFLYTLGLPVQMLVGGLTTFGFAVVQALKGGKASFRNLYGSINPLEYVKAGVTVTGKAAKGIVKSAYQGIYGLGQVISGIFSGASKPPK